MEEGALKKPLQRSQINNYYDTHSIATENLGPRKHIRVYVDKDIEFSVEISNNELTCRWLLSEVTRRYTDALSRIKMMKDMQP